MGARRWGPTFQRMADKELGLTAHRASVDKSVLLETVMFENYRSSFFGDSVTIRGRQGAPGDCRPVRLSRRIGFCSY
jgi:hypothetical protein